MDMKLKVHGTSCLPVCDEDCIFSYGIWDEDFYFIYYIMGWRSKF